jgi:magnesium-transporting ATPase (P-type)
MASAHPAAPNCWQPQARRQRKTLLKIFEETPLSGGCCQLELSGTARMVAIPYDPVTQRAASVKRWTITPVDSLLQQLATTPAGLTSDQAAERLKQLGVNEPAAPRVFAAAIQLLWLFLDPLPRILLIAAGVSAFVGEFVSAMTRLGFILTWSAALYASIRCQQEKRPAKDLAIRRGRRG